MFCFPLYSSALSKDWTSTTRSLLHHCQRLPAIFTFHVATDARLSTARNGWKPDVRAFLCELNENWKCSQVAVMTQSMCTVMQRHHVPCRTHSSWCIHDIPRAQKTLLFSTFLSPSQKSSEANASSLFCLLPCVLPSATCFSIMSTLSVTLVKYVCFIERHYSPLGDTCQVRWGGIHFSTDRKKMCTSGAVLVNSSFKIRDEWVVLKACAFPSNIWHNVFHWWTSCRIIVAGYDRVGTCHILKWGITGKSTPHGNAFQAIIIWLRMD